MFFKFKNVSQFKKNLTSKVRISLIEAASTLCFYFCLCWCWFRHYSQAHKDKLCELNKPLQARTDRNTHIINVPDLWDIRGHHGLHCSAALRWPLRSEFGAASCHSPEQKPEPPGDLGGCQPERDRRPARTQYLQNSILAVCWRIREEVPSTAGRCCCCCCCFHKCLPTVLCLETQCKLNLTDSRVNIFLKHVVVYTFCAKIIHRNSQIPWVRRSVSNVKSKYVNK